MLFGETYLLRKRRHTDRVNDRAMAAPSATRLRFNEVTSSEWDDFEALFERPGGPKHCWCMVWRALPSAARSDQAAKKRAKKARILAAQPVGLPGYHGAQPVASCSVAPRDTFRNLGGAEAAGADVWSLVCMFVKREWRGVAVSKQLIRAAIQLARHRGADVLEAYPVDPKSPSYRFMGFVPVFQELGFQQVGQVGGRRHVMRLKL